MRHVWTSRSPMITRSNEMLGFFERVFGSHWNHQTTALGLEKYHQLEFLSLMMIVSVNQVNCDLNKFLVSFISHYSGSD